MISYKCSYKVCTGNKVIRENEGCMPVILLCAGKGQSVVSLEVPPYDCCSTPL